LLFTPECSISRNAVPGVMPILGPRNDEYPQDPDRGRRLRTARGAGRAARAARGIESIAVDNGTKGVQAAKAGQIDLVIMDVGLPDVDGREAVRILRKNGFKAPSSC